MNEIDEIILALKNPAIDDEDYRDNERLIRWLEGMKDDLARAADACGQVMVTTHWAFAPESGLGLVYNTPLRVTGKNPFWFDESTVPAAPSPSPSSP